MGSALVFRAAFAMIADKAAGAASGSHEQRVHRGTKIALDDASNQLRTSSLSWRLGKRGNERNP